MDFDFFFDFLMVGTMPNKREFSGNLIGYFLGIRSKNG